MHYLGILFKKIRLKKNFDYKKVCGSKKIMAIDIIYKNETKFDEDNNFSIDLTSNNEIQNMMFREPDTWLVSCLGLKIKKFEDSDEYAQVKKVSDLINKIKKKQKNNIRMEKFKQNYQIFIILMSIAWYVLSFPTIK